MCKKRKLFFIAACMLLICVGCSSEQKNIEINVEEIQSMFFSADCQFLVEENGNTYMEAVYENDAQFQEEVLPFLENIYEKYEACFAYGSRGDDLSSYENRYSGFLTWIHEDGSILEIELCRNDDKNPMLKIRFLSEKILSMVGMIEEVNELTFSVTTMEEHDGFDIYWDYHGVYMYPYLIDGVAEGKKVRLYYLDEASSFSDVNGNKCCHIKAMEIID